MLPKVSIQIPTYNQAGLMEKAIQSCLAQDYQNLEIIVADDNSKDNTEEVVKKYLIDFRVKYFKNPINLGRVDNYRNALQNLVTGDWVINLDGDDYFAVHNFISDAINELLRDVNQDVVLYMAQNFYLKKIARKFSIPIQNNFIKVNGLIFLENYSYFPHFLHLSSLFNRKAALEKNFYEKDSLNADFASLMQLADSGSFIITDRKVGEWNVNENSASQTLDDVNNEKNIEAINFLVNNLTFKNDRQKRRTLDGLLYVNKYHLVSSYKKDVRSLFHFLKLLSFRNYYWRGITHFLIKK